MSLTDHSQNISQSISDLLSAGREKLKQHNDDAYQDVLLLLAHASGHSKETLLAHPELNIDTSIIMRYQNFLERRINHEPLAYITGQKEFWSLPLHINKDVLIPRPETELVVDIALQHLADNQALQILDLATGSGCIALAIAKHRPLANVMATDISEPSLEVAQANAKQLEIKNIRFIKSDWFKKINSNSFHCIVSNPPYIAHDDEHLDSSVKKHEPHEALFADDNGLSCLKHIIQNAGNYLQNNGVLIVEHGWQQASSVQTLFAQYAYQDIHTHTDLQGHPRATSASINKQFD